jgi:hemolysin III
VILDDVKLIQYSKGETILNSLTHGAGTLFGFAAFFACLIKAARVGGAVTIAAASLYGISMIILYSSSTIYHAFPDGTVKKILRMVDHSMIYLLIAGTMTPIALLTLMKYSPARAWLLLFFAWGGLIAGVLATVFSFEKTKVLQMVLYIGIGWVSLIAVRPLIRSFDRAGFWLILAGGVVYTLGVIFYGLGRKVKYMHALFHVFVLGGSVLHFIAIFQYVIV